eukprot:11521304-Alexandrium_andersonii.AAC.1
MHVKKCAHTAHCMQTTANAANARHGKYVRRPLIACKRPQTRPTQDMASMLKGSPTQSEPTRHQSARMVPPGESITAGPS